jgi:hypothetical protein
MTIKELLTGIACIGLIILFMGLAGQSDYEMAASQHEHCLTMVEAGAWPKEVCRGL